jgi:peptide-methionine (R)-S-oxide reductase
MSEWREQLTPEQFNICRGKGTERAFTGKYWDTKTPGIYRCACCGEALFDSASKYDSGSGWPSFYAPVAEAALRTETDVVPWHGAHRGVVSRLRCAPRACVSRRAAPHGTALLHQLGLAGARGACAGNDRAPCPSRPALVPRCPHSCLTLQDAFIECAPSWSDVGFKSPSSRGLGHCPFTAVTGVRIP